MPLITYMSENKNNSLIFSSFTNSYIYLLNAIKLLIEQQIVHFDLKGLNIVYNTDNNHYTYRFWAVNTCRYSANKKKLLQLFLCLCS